MSSKTWKDALLRSSLPLEQIVARKFFSNKFDVYGEYPYIRSDETGHETEFSVDIWAVKFFELNEEDTWGELHLLAECKYSYPGVKWVFAPHIQDEFIDPSILTIYDQICSRQIQDKRPAFSLVDDLQFVFKGIELHANDSNPQAIERGISQLRYALPQFSSHVVSMQGCEIHDEDLKINLVCPLLVTTAEIYVLREGLGLKEIQAAKELNEIADRANAVILDQPIGPHLFNYSHDLFQKLLSECPQIVSRDAEISELKKDEFASRMPLWSLQCEYNKAPQAIVVIPLDALNDFLKKVCKITKKLGNKLKRHGRLVILEEGKLRHETPSRIIKDC